MASQVIIPPESWMSLELFASYFYVDLFSPSMTYVLVYCAQIGPSLIHLNLSP